MNYKLNSYLSILAIACAVAVPLLSATARELPVQAALTAPSGWTYKYTNQDFPGYKIRSTTAVISTPEYTRTADGAYYNYTNTSTITTGLTVQQIFNRSNTTWYDASGTYVPSDTKIGSNNTVGSTSRKWYFKYDNQTNKDYKIFLDFSSTADINRVYHLYINGQVYINNLDNNRLYYVDANKLFQVWLPAFSYVEFFTENNASNTNYFDSWYLQDLGFNTAYSNGYDAGEEIGYIDGLENSNFLITAVESLIGMMVNFTFIMFSLEIFGVNILMIIGVLFGIIAITWILKTIRG
jgi:hypothetical protein